MIMDSQTDSTVLIVDDDPSISGIIKQALTQEGFRCTTAHDVPTARTMLKEHTYDLMLLDQRLPGESGLSLLRSTVLHFPFMPILMITGARDAEAVMEALDAGAAGYLQKPFPLEQLVTDIRQALTRRQLELENWKTQACLSTEIARQTRVLQTSLRTVALAKLQQESVYDELICRLALVGEPPQAATLQHLQRISHLAVLLASRAHWSTDRCELMRLASPLHDIGTLGAHTAQGGASEHSGDSNNENPSRIDHTMVGRDLLAGSTSPVLQLAASIAWSHHEHYDGSGHPRGLRGDDIPEEGRILAIVDRFDALMTARFPSGHPDLNSVLSQLQAERGQQLDPRLLDLFVAPIDEVTAIMQAFPDPPEPPRSKRRSSS